MNILGQIFVQKKSCQIFEKIIIFEKISHVDMGQIFASFLQFGQFFQNMSPINAKSLWGGSLMMLLKKTEKTLVEISRKLENPAVKRPYRWRYPLNRNFLTWTMVITISSLDLMPMRCPQVTILWVPTLVTPRITPVSEKLPFCSDNPQMIC